VCVGDEDVYDDDEGGDDDIEESSGGSGQAASDMMSHHVDSRYSHHRHRHMLPPVPVDPRFDPVDNDPSRRLPTHRLSTRRRPVMYTAAGATGPVFYTTPGHIYFTRRRNYVGNAASVSRLASLTLLAVTCSISIVVDGSLSAVS